MQKGGIQLRFADQTPELAADFFISNSECLLLTRSTKGGIMFTLTLNNGLVSPYISTRSNHPNQEVRSIILKLVFIGPHGYRLPACQIDLNECTTQQFRKEVQTQCDIFQESLDQYLEPICPSIAYSHIFSSAAEKNDFLLYLHANSLVGITAIVLDQINNDVHLPTYNIGYIVMEKLEGFIKVSETLGDDPANVLMYKKMVIYELWRLYNLTGRYIHGDPHLENFMIDINYNYLTIGPGHVIIIDFGNTFKHEDAIIPVVAAPQIPDTDIMQITDITLDNDVPGNNFGNIQLTPFHVVPFSNRYWHSYQWLNSPAIPIARRGIWNTRLKIIHDSRDAAKILFDAYVATNNNALVVLPAHIYMPGGSSKKNKRYKHKSRARGRKTRHKNKYVLDYAKLDPHHILNTTFINNYIESEYKNANMIKTYVNKINRSSKSSKSSKSNKSSKSKKK